jgi:hypothetical protein
MLKTDAENLLFAVDLAGTLLSPLKAGPRLAPANSIYSG